MHQSGNNRGPENRLRRHFAAAMAVVLSLLWLSMAYAAESRIALVIGNSAYRADPLMNPVNDASAVSTALSALGFEVVTLKNASFREMISAMQSFSVKAKAYQVRLVYFAGHGIQIKGRNFLIPIDAELASQDDVARKMIDLNDLIARLGDIRSGMNIFILDACRNNPFNNLPALNKDGRRIIVRGTESNGGLARVDAPLGTLVAYSTSPGAVAMDSTTSPNSVYTKHLLRNMDAPGQTIEHMFKRVRIDVAKETQNLQIPWEASSLMTEFCFRNAGDRPCGKSSSSK